MSGNTRPWADKGGRLEKVLLEQLAVPQSYRLDIALDLRQTVLTMLQDPRATEDTKDLVRDYLLANPF